ncbi:MAG: alpha-dextrin endo,6-alpha-glucosidase [Segetibacter sp.]|nr:alpha-dextrin endo,6-alpha-glucosidase [Segetibacter sp.]
MQEDIYVAGNFNNWNPKDEKYKLKPFGTSRRAIVLKDLPAGKYEFKFTRGGWNKVETTAKGVNMNNREVYMTSDVSQDVNIEGWSDDFPDKPKLNTATAQVRVVEEAFDMPQLNRKRRIWAYLPKGYTSSKKSYPVIYMHDGQNLFSEETAAFGEWGVDETLDTLMSRLGKEAIVIGIDNDPLKRINEYNPYDTKEFGKGEGDLYVDFMAQTLKPYIDGKFRTLKDAANTYTAGSSMGGLISLYAVLKYPKVFGGAGVFSPAFWTSPGIFEALEKADWKGSNLKFFFYAGGKESNQMVPDMDRVISIIEKKGNYKLRRVMAPLGQHNEKTWRQEFSEFYRFVCGF